MDKKRGQRVFMVKKEKKANWIRIAALLVCISAAIGFFYYQENIGPFATDTMGHLKIQDGRTEKEVQADFERLADEIFKDEITGDSLTLNYTLRNREAYNIEEIEPTLGQYTLEDLQNGLMVSENRVARLESFDYDKLTEEQKLIYDIVYKMSKDNLQSADFLEYTEYLGPTSGVQAQLPVLLSEYHFYTKKDVEDYISLLKLVPECFKQILDFEKQKSEQGIFMNDATAQAIIDQCTEFIKRPEDNYLITVFDGKISEVEGISDEEQKKFSAENKEAVLQKLIPAYKKLIDGLKGLKGTGKNTSGLCHLEKGKEYYTYLVKQGTGSDKTPEEISELLDEKLTSLTKEMAKVMAENPEVYYDAQEVTYPYDTPEKAMKHLKVAVQKDFPALDKSISCKIKKVDSSQEEHMSPAFYLTPAIDDYKENVVYINESDRYDLSRAFTTIGHESYPGHLYQTCYFNEKNPHPLRNVISVKGYTEGWGTYAELYSYDLAEINKDVAELLKLNTLSTLCLYARADVGIHYEGWDYDKLNEYLSNFGFSKSSSRIIFDTLVAEPASYLPYTVGYLEIDALLNRAKEKLEGTFKLKDFHEFFLSVGTAPFSIIENRLEKCLAEGQWSWGVEK